MAKDLHKVQNFLENKVCKTERDYFRTILFLEEVYKKKDFNVQLTTPNEKEKIFTFEQLHIFITT